MTNEDLALEVLLEFLNAVEAGVAGAKQRIKTSKIPEWQLANIPWVKAEGAHGQYERYPAEGEKPEAIQDYLALLSDLKAHDCKLTRDARAHHKGNYFSFTFQIIVLSKPF